MDPTDATPYRTGGLTRRRFVATSGIALSGLLTGCAADDSNGSDGNGGPGFTEVKGTAAPELTPAPEPADLVGGPQWKAPDLSGQQLTMWGLNYAPHVDRYKRLAAQFKELTGATVNVQPQDDPQGKILAALAGGNVPDVICLMGQMSDQVVKAKGLLEIDDVVFGDLSIDIEKWWLPDAIGAYQFPDRKHYGVPVESNNCSTVTGRTDLIDQAGSAAKALWPGAAPESEWPEKGVWFDSYDDLYELAGRIQQKASDGKVKVWGMNNQGWEFMSIMSIMYQLGTFWWDDEEGTFNLDNDAAVQAIDLTVTFPYGKKIESKLGVGNVVNGFVAKQVALALNNTGAAGEGAKLKIPGENVLLPSAVAGEQPVFVGQGGWGFEIPAQAKNRDAAIEFLRFMCTYDAQFTWSQIYGGAAPACHALIDSAIYQGSDPLKVGLRRVVIGLENTRYQGHGFDPQSLTLPAEIINTIREGKLTSKDGAAQLQQQLTELQERWANS